MKILSRFIVPFILALMLIFTGILGYNYKNPKAKNCRAFDKITVYLAVGEEFVLPEINNNTLINHYPSYKTENDAVSIEKNIIKGNRNGVTKVTLNCKEYEVIVSDLYTKPEINNSKPFLPCGRFDKQGNDFLDAMLKKRIAKAGYYTRAGAVEAMRFITLQFPYKMAYFYENGRLEVSNEDGIYADGEGRYYHKGMYLHESRYDVIDENGAIYGPQIWGCSMYSDPDERYISNGLDCSGLITWALYNAGYDIKDIGAGPFDETYDLTDLGTKIFLSVVEMDELKPGDLLGVEGHVGMIIGIDEEHIYVGHSYWEGDLQVSTYTPDELRNNKLWEYAVLMDKCYLNDGNLTDMWQSENIFSE